MIIIKRGILKAGKLSKKNHSQNEIFSKKSQEIWKNNITNKVPTKIWRGLINKDRSNNISSTLPTINTQRQNWKKIKIENFFSKWKEKGSSMVEAMEICLPTSIRMPLNPQIFRIPKKAMPLITQTTLNKLAKIMKPLPGILLAPDSSWGDITQPSFHTEAQVFP